MILNLESIWRIFHQKLKNSQKIHFKSILELIKNCLKPIYETLIILDCCNASNFDLPFILHEGKFKRRNDNFIDHDIMVITSCRSNEKAISQDSGSTFTQFLLKEKLKRNLSYIIDNVSKNITRITGHIQNIVVACSLPQKAYFYHWFTKSKMIYTKEISYIVI